MVKQSCSQYGFTLIELIVVIGIIGVILSVIVFAHGTLTDKLGVGEALQEMTTTIRQAEVYGDIVKESVAGAGDFTHGYGVFFDLAHAQSYYLFVDKNNNNYYDGNDVCTPSSECVTKSTLKRNVSITSFCATSSQGVRTCPLTGVSKVSVIFIRPSADAHIYLFNQNDDLLTGTYSSVEVMVSNPQGDQTGRVFVQNTGQVGIK